jgi:hypothetical protein
MRLTIRQKPPKRQKDVREVKKTRRLGQFDVRMNEQPFYFILFCPLQARYDEY